MVIIQAKKWKRIYVRLEYHRAVLKAWARDEREESSEYFLSLLGRMDKFKFEKHVNSFNLIFIQAS